MIVMGDPEDSDDGSGEAAGVASGLGEGVSVGEGDSVDEGVARTQGRKMTRPVPLGSTWMKPPGIG
jgi:hypothetical protein